MTPTRCRGSTRLFTRPRCASTLAPVARATTTHLQSTFPCCTTNTILPLVDGSSDASSFILTGTSSGNYYKIHPAFGNLHFDPARLNWRDRRQPPPKQQHPVKGPHRKYPRRVPAQHVSLQLGEKFYEEVHAYQDKFIPLIDAEQAEDEAVLKERLASWSLERLKQEGYCITDMNAFWLDKCLFGRPAATFWLGPGIRLPLDHRFENGTQVLVTKLDPLREEPKRGSVVRTLEDRLHVSFLEKFDLDEGPWRLDVGRSSIVYDRMREAIKQFHRNPALDEGRSTTDREVILQGTYLRDILLRSFTPHPLPEDIHYHTLQSKDDMATKAQDDDVDEGMESIDTRPPLPLDGLFRHDSRIHSWAKRYSRPNPVVVEGDPILEGVNSTQIRAIAMMLHNSFTLVQGPPGTGKTKTIMEAVRLLKVHFQVPYPILLCTYTNVAVDHLVEGLVNAALNPLRIGYHGKVKSSLISHTLDAKLEKHPLAPELQRLKEQANTFTERHKALLDKISQLRKKALKMYAARLLAMETDAVALERQINSLKAKEYAVYLRMVRDIVTSADVVCTTSVTTASSSLHVVDFPLVFIDEASMSTEPASLIPLMRGSRHIALIGDHKQLPPVITSPEAQAQGLGISLFERLSEENLLPSIMLDIQYRMHPTISRFPSDEFYNSSLKDGTVDVTGSISPRLLPPESIVFPTTLEKRNRPSVIFLDHVGAESMKDRSRVNWNEAHVVCSLVEDLLLNNEHLQGNDIGIIAPYVAQISLLTRLLNLDANYKRRFEGVLGSRRAMQLANVEVKTVDGFEGREKDIIIFSTVRNNPQGHIGFLADCRRLNVGLTRAKRGLFVVGSIRTLKAGKMSGGAGSIQRVGKGAEAWRRYADFLAKQNLVVQLNGENLRRVLYGNLLENNQMSITKQSHQYI